MHGKKWKKYNDRGDKEGREVITNHDECSHLLAPVNPAEFPLISHIRLGDTWSIKHIGCFSLRNASIYVLLQIAWFTFDTYDMIWFSCTIFNKNTHLYKIWLLFTVKKSIKNFISPFTYIRTHGLNHHIIHEIR